MIIEYGHPDLGEEVTARAGYYVPLEEHTFPYGDREVIYILGHACIDNSCCATGGTWGYVQVPGFLVRKHIRGTDTPTPISEVELIQDEDDRRNIKKSLSEKHPGIQIDMWSAGPAVQEDYHE
ncbi:hypothetical protein ACFLXE_05975 [Chloroflexota bacterium]